MHPGEVRLFSFSKEKSPYRTVATAGIGSAVRALWVHLSPLGLEVGGGLQETSADQLGRARSAIVGHAHAGEELVAISGSLEAEGFRFAGPDLRTTPRGFPGDDPRIALLRRTPPRRQHPRPGRRRAGRGDPGDDDGLRGLGQLRPATGG